MGCTKMKIAQNQHKNTIKGPCITQKRKSTVTVLHTRFDPIYITIKFHEDIPNSYQVMGGTGIVLGKKISKVHNLETIQWKTFFLAHDTFSLPNTHSYKIVS